MKLFMPLKLIRVLCLILCLSFGLATLPVSVTAHGVTLKTAEASTKKKAKRVKKTYGNKKATSKRIAIVQKQTPQDETSRWAALVVDANEGKILFEKNADSLRHPASLTKMMTLYLLFDALENRRYSLNTILTASAKAASQPATNIFLDPGDRLSVQTAVEALIIRSANDVAMVVAESIGGSQEGFARMMNRKAKELGMSKTRFYNPSGLPDDRQVTTASDLARLAIALRRDFPQYYSYFKKSEFDYAGKTYTTHNRVVGRYPGADGLKTGYIRASGFNLVTSVARGKTRLVGVIMGGSTAASRDQAMMNMLDNTIFAMNRTGTSKNQYTSLDKPSSRKRVEQEQPSEPAPELELAQTETASGQETGHEPSIEDVIQTHVITKKPIPQLPPAADATLADTLPPSFVSEKNWAIQVGAFPTREQAERAAKNARNLAASDLAKAQLEISIVQKDGRTFNRSRMIYLTSDEAKNACNQLVNANKVCMILHMDN